MEWRTVFTQEWTRHCPGPLCLTEIFIYCTLVRPIYACSTESHRGHRYRHGLIVTGDRAVATAAVFHLSKSSGGGSCIQSTVGIYTTQNLYIGWSDVTESMVIKLSLFCRYNMTYWRKCIALFKQNWIKWSKTMSLWSLIDQQSVLKRYHSKKHLWEFYPQNGGENQLA